MKKELNFERGRLGYITRWFCTGFYSLEFNDYENQTPFKSMAFEIIADEVFRYKLKLAGAKIK
ncbi:MAG: hypothetical protein LBE72_05325 [Rickettsia sp.]|nr:hypothetical protein [Rickettsia sp.]